MCAIKPDSAFAHTCPVGTYVNAQKSTDRHPHCSSLSWGSKKELGLAPPPQVLLYSDCKWLLQRVQLARPLKLRQGVGLGGLAFLTELIGSEEAKFAIQSQTCVKLQPGQGKWEASSFSHTFSRHHLMPGRGMRPARVNAAPANPGGSSAPPRMTLSVLCTGLLEQPGCCHLLARHQTCNSCLITTFFGHYCFTPGVQRRRTD